MRLYPFHTPALLIKAFPGLTWRMDTQGEKVLYLTFDDGPDPCATPFVLDLLDQYDAKATFFVVGENVKRHSDLFQQIVSKAHRIGNHTHRHVSGWSTSKSSYLKDVIDCQEVLGDAGQVENTLFRPPYGRLTPGKAKQVRKAHQVIMWSLLSGDFDSNLNVQASLSALDRALPGDIIVFHDSEKSLPNLKQLLPSFLERFHRKGYKFAML